MSTMTTSGAMPKDLLDMIDAALSAMSDDENIGDIVDRLFDRILSDAGMRRACAFVGLDTTIRTRNNLLRQAAMSTRPSERHARPSTAYNPVGGRYNVAVAAQARVADYLSVFWGGKPLGAMTRDDLERAISKRRTEAAGHLRNARFLEGVLLRVTDGRLVRDCWTNNELETVHEAAFEEAA